MIRGITLYYFFELEKGKEDIRLDIAQSRTSDILKCICLGENRAEKRGKKREKRQWDKAAVSKGLKYQI